MKLHLAWIYSECYALVVRSIGSISTNKVHIPPRLDIIRLVSNVLTDSVKEVPINTSLQLSSCIYIFWLVVYSQLHNKLHKQQADVPHHFGS